MNYADLVEAVGKAIDAAGVVVIAIGALFVTVRYALRAVHGANETSFRIFRQGLGRAILLGLEFLVAGDIIRTVINQPTFNSVGVLAAIVGIRWFLSTTLELEIEGRWPWQRRVVPTENEPPVSNE
jgi:uncharacterized membrane protein